MAGRRSGTLDIIEQRRRNGSKYRSLRDKGGKGPTELRSRGGPATLDKCMMGNIQGPGPHHGTGHAQEDYGRRYFSSNGGSASN